jgi:hypothetical protein
MCLLKKVVILIVLLAALVFPISASGDMSGSGQASGPSTGDATGGTIIIETSGGYSGGYYPGQQGGFTTGQPSSFTTSGYQSLPPRGITLGYNRPAGDTSSVTNPNPDTITKDIQDKMNGLTEDLWSKQHEYELGTLSPDKFAKYCINFNWNLKKLKSELETLQKLANDASQAVESHRSDRPLESNITTDTN